MKNSLLLFLVAALVLTSQSSCDRRGCTHPSAVNYDANATREDGSCIFQDPGPIETTGRVYLLYSGVERPETVRVNGLDLTQQLIDITDMSPIDFCNPQSHDYAPILLPVQQAFTLRAHNGTYEWDIPLYLELINGVSQCKVIVLTEANGMPISGGKTGVTFTSRTESGIRNISISINGDSVGYLPEWSSGPAVLLTKELAPGRYGYSAKSQNGHLWADSFTVTANKLEQIPLVKATATMPAGTGNLVFYSPKYKNVSVFLDNKHIGTTTNAYTGNLGDLCTAPNVVSYISQGDTTYNYTATSSDGGVWSGTVSANAGAGCILTELK